MVLLEGGQTCAGSSKVEVVETLTKGFGGVAGTKAWPKHVPRARRTRGARAEAARMHDPVMCADGERR